MSQYRPEDERFPRLGEDAPATRHRGRVIRMAAFYTFWLLILGAFAAVGAYNLFARGDGGFVVMMGIGLFFGALVLHQASQYLRDLASRPVVHEGEVIRKWHKGNILIFFPSFYIMAADRIFTVNRADYAMLLEDDQVRITCYPHSLTIELLERYDSAEKQFVPASFGTN